MLDKDVRRRSLALAVIRLSVAVMCVGTSARWLPYDSAVFGLLYFDHGFVGETAAARIDDGLFIALAVAGLLVLTPFVRPAAALIAIVMLVLAGCETIGAPRWPEIIPLEQAVRFVTPLALWFGLDRTRRIEPSRRGAFELALRLGVAATFVGHGLAAWSLEPGFLDLLFSAQRNLLGTDLEQVNAERLLRVIGAVDFAVAALLLTTRWRGVAWWMAFWGLLTATARMVHAGVDAWPETGLRIPNSGIPLAIAILFGVTTPHRDPAPNERT